MLISKREGERERFIVERVGYLVGDRGGREVTRMGDRTVEFIIAVECNFVSGVV